MPHITPQIAHTGYEVICSGFMGAFSAQLIKFIAYGLANRRLDFKWLIQTGGMPSSHSGAMCAMATSVGLVSGWDSVDFAIAMGVSLVVMYDAAGLRRSAGRMASVLNRITEDFYANHAETIPDRLRELLGHTPFEVLVGAILGAMIACYYHYSLFSP